MDLPSVLLTEKGRPLTTARVVAARLGSSCGMLDYARG